MSIKTVDMYTVECDFMGCQKTEGDFNAEYAAWSKKADARTSADLSDWRLVGELDFCPLHASDVCRVCASVLNDPEGERGEYECFICLPALAN